MCSLGLHRTLWKHLEEILDDIDCVQQALGKDTASSKIIAKIKNTMSDRHSAEKLFNDLIHDFRAGVLPTIIENWDHLHESEQQQFNRMNNFFVVSILLLDWLTQLKKQ